MNKEKEKGLTEIENQKVKNTIKKFARIINLAFAKEKDNFKGVYCLLCSQVFIEKYLTENCEDKDEFNEIRVWLYKVLIQYAQNVFAMEYKEGGQNE